MSNEISEKRDEIRKIFSGSSSGLLEMSVGTAYGQGSFPLEYTADTSLKGNSIYFSWSDKDEAHHYLPVFGFEFTVGRRIISPFNENSGRVVSFQSKGMRSIHENEENIHLWISLPDEVNFFDVWDSIQNNVKFVPYELKGDISLLHNIESPHSTTFAAFVSDYEIHAEIPKNTAMEDLILEIVNIFRKDSENFHQLKPLYKDKDDDGTRLWDDQGLQSGKYYRLRSKLGKKLLYRIAKVLRKHGIPYRRNWGVSGALWFFGSLLQQKDPILVFNLAQFGWGSFKDSVKSLFKSDKEIQRGRIEAHKNELYKK